MLSIASGKLKIYAYTRQTDMRKGFAGLSGIIRSEFQADPTDGSLFLFLNGRRDRMKLLHFVDGGFWLYLNDPHLPIDSNSYEQLMKQTTLGRKNWLFAGALAGVEREAGFMTLISSAHRNDLDVWGYVNDVLQRLLAGETNYEPPLP